MASCHRTPFYHDLRDGQKLSPCCVFSFEGGTAAESPITALRLTSKLETFAADPLVATVLTNGGSLPAVWVEEDLETDARPTDAESKYEQLHKGALHGG
jgi:hypothetical protein